MTDSTHSLPHNLRPTVRGAWFFSILILAMVGAMLAWNAHVRYQEFAAYQQQLMERSVDGTAAEIGVFIGELRRSVHLFTDTERALLDRLAEEPQDQQALDKVNMAVRKHFPEAFAFTLADNAGAPLLDDFDGLVGEICINDMRTFVTHREHSKVYIHPNPTTYHFDIMVDREHNGDSAGIFFVSFTTDILSRTLQHGEVPGHKLLLLKQDVPGLIEVASEGARIKLQREFKLSAEEVARIGYITPVNGTSWDLVDLPDPDLYTSMRDHILRESVLVALAFLTITGSMLWLLYRSQAKRRVLEHLYHHDPVTGLPNSHLFLERFAYMTSPVPGNRPSFAVLLIDVGRFHRLKGTFFEHRTDDLLTRAVAERIEKALCGAKIVAKIGDNDYAVLLAEQTPEQLESVVRNVLAELKKPFGADNDIVLPNPCMGSALYPLDGEDLQTLLRHAGTQIYSARQQGATGPATQAAAAPTAP